MTSRVLTVPNQLTLLRLGFLPFFLISLYYGRYGWALLLLSAAAVTDLLDGLLARRLNQKTELGAYLDPIADKLLLSSSFFLLASAAAAFENVWLGRAGVVSVYLVAAFTILSGVHYSFVIARRLSGS
jgi:phosphatidylglycerophosphate synthase